MNREVFEQVDWEKLSPDYDPEPVDTQRDCLFYLTYHILQNLLTGESGHLGRTTLHNPYTTPLVEEEVLFLTGADEVRLHVPGTLKEAVYRKTSDEAFNYGGRPTRSFTYELDEESSSFVMDHINASRERIERNIRNMTSKLSSS